MTGLPRREPRRHPHRARHHGRGRRSGRPPLPVCPDVDGLVGREETPGAQGGHDVVTHQGRRVRQRDGLLRRCRDASRRPGAMGWPGAHPPPRAARFACQRLAAHVRGPHRLGRWARRRPLDRCPLGCRPLDRRRSTAGSTAPGSRDRTRAPPSGGGVADRQLVGFRGLRRPAVATGPSGVLIAVVRPGRRHSRHQVGDLCWPCLHGPRLSRLRRLRPRLLCPCRSGPRLSGPRPSEPGVLPRVCTTQATGRPEVRNASITPRVVQHATRTAGSGRGRLEDDPGTHLPPGLGTDGALRHAVEEGRHGEANVR